MTTIRLGSTPVACFVMVLLLFFAEHAVSANTAAPPSSPPSPSNQNSETSTPVLPDMTTVEKRDQDSALSKTFSNPAELDNTPQLIPHIAQYTAKIKKGISLNGTATRTLSKMANGDWSYSFIVKTAPADITETSKFRQLQSGLWKPYSYNYELSGFFVKDRKQSVAFDLDNGKANESYKDRNWSVSVSPTILDRLNYQLRLQTQVADPNAELVYDVLHKGKIRTYKFAVLKTETISTAIGEKEAIVVEKVRDESKKRETRLWFDSAAPHALLKMIQVEDSGEMYEINIIGLELPERSK
jgi:hypothetical protein